MNKEIITKLFESYNKEDNILAFEYLCTYFTANMRLLNLEFMGLLYFVGNIDDLYVYSILKDGSGYSNCTIFKNKEFLLKNINYGTK